MKIKILILMTVSMLFLTVHFLVVPVKGQALSDEITDNKLIIIEGRVNESYYEKEGYEIIQNNVNSLEEGNYEIVYQSLDDGMIYTKEVVVLKKESKEYFNIDTCTIETFKDYPMILEKSVSLNKEEQILLVRYITNVEKDLGHLYMYYIRNNQIIKEILLYYNQTIKVNDLIVDNDEFIVIGQIWNSLYASYDILFVVCDKNGFRKCSNIIGGSKTENAFTGMVLDDSYLVLGITDSEDQIFEGNKKNNGFIIQIDKEQYEVINVEYNKNYLNANNFNFIKLSEEIKLLTQEDNIIYLTELNEKGKVIKESKVSYEEKIKILDVYASCGEIKLVLERNGLEVGTINSKGYQTINVLNKELKAKNVEFYNQMLNVLYEIDNGCKLEVYDEEFSKVYEKEIYQTFNDIDNLDMLNQVVIERLDNKIKIHKMEYLKILTMGQTNLSVDNYHDYQIIINGKKVIHNPILTIDNIEEEIFGNYEINYYFNGDLDLIVNKDVKVDTTCDLIDKGIYDKGLIINHNGVLFLNDLRIESGYVINEIGNYTLELVGKNEASKVINFTVKDLSTKVIESEEKITLVDIEVIDSSYEVGKINCNYYEKEKDLSQNINHQWDFMYMIPILLTLGLSFFIIKFRY